TPDSPGITQIASPVTTQPRIVQVGQPQLVRALEADEQLAGPSPLRVANNGWDSDMDDDDSDSFAKDVMQAFDKSA
ncbi:hypothetical protein IWW50_001239, partial [Coemansia erecta]